MLFLWHAAALLSGSSIGLLGVYVVGMRMPFLGIGIAHAALAGAVAGHVFGFPPFICALLFALIAALLMSWLTTSSAQADLGTVTGIMLSFTMGIAFLAMGFNQGDMSPVLSMMWGSILFVRTTSLVLMAVLSGVLFVFLYFCRLPMDSLLFSRTAAHISGMNEKKLLMVFMLISAFVITVNLQIVGGLLMYSLLTNPAATAYALGRNMKSVRAFAMLSGVVSTIGGLWISYLWDLSTGACIVLFSTALYSLALIATWKFKKQPLQ